MAVSNEGMAQGAVETQLKCWQGRKGSKKKRKVVPVANLLLVGGEMVAAFIGE
jgi:hypothetical protein